MLKVSRNQVNVLDLWNHGRKKGLCQVRTQDRLVRRPDTLTTAPPGVAHLRL